MAGVLAMGGKRVDRRSARSPSGPTGFETSPDRGSRPRLSRARPLRTVRVDLPHTALQSVVELNGERE